MELNYTTKRSPLFEKWRIQPILNHHKLYTYKVFLQKELHGNNFGGTTVLL